MHLTPRTLGLGIAATLTGCTMLGVLASLDLAGAARPDAPGVSAVAPAMVAAAPLPPAVVAEVDDRASTSPPVTPSASAQANGTPAPTLPLPPTSFPAPKPSPPERAPREPARTASPHATRAPSPPAPARTAPAASATPPRPPTPTPRRTATRNPWHAPTLAVGTTAITRPRLTSGARVSVTVACSPGAGCSMTGSQLHVAAGTSVTVTWSAPSRPGYTAWRTSRVL